jgi:hypothetical protein
MNMDCSSHKRAQRTQNNQPRMGTDERGFLTANPSELLTTRLHLISARQAGEHGF